MASEEKPTVEDSFRDTLQDVIVVVKKLAPCCRSVNDLIGMAELAMQNDGQLFLLMEKVGPVTLRQ